MLSHQASHTSVSVNDIDVLSGRGAKSNSHLGNKLFRSLVKSNRAQYQQLKNNAHKVILAESIIAAINARGGRFLKRASKDSNEWYQLSKEEAITKTQQALREIPAGTSSRALNVERMLEKSRINKQRTEAKKKAAAAAPSASSSSTTFGMMAASAAPAPLPATRVSTASTISSSSVQDYHVDTTVYRTTIDEMKAATTSRRSSNNSSHHDDDDAMLSDDELESLMSDSDAVQTLCSLLE